MGNPSPEGFEVLQTIHDRYELVSLLSEAAHDKPDFVTQLSMSRSTVDRAIDQLLEYDIIERTESGYAITTPGIMILQCYERTVEIVGPIFDTSRVLRYIPTEIAVPFTLLDTATVHVADRFEPGLPQRRFLEIAEGAAQIRGIIPVTNEQYIDFLYHRVVELGKPTELVTETQIVDYLQKHKPRIFREILSADCCDIHVIDATIEFGLSLFDGDEHTITLCCYDFNKHFQGLIVDRFDNHGRWAESIYEKFLDKATVIGPDSVHHGV